MTVLENGVYAGAWRTGYGAVERYCGADKRYKESDKQYCDRCRREIREEDDANDGKRHDTLCSECYLEEEE